MNYRLDPLKGHQYCPQECKEPSGPGKFHGAKGLKGNLAFIRATYRTGTKRNSVVKHGWGAFSQTKEDQKEELEL